MDIRLGSRIIARTIATVGVVGVLLAPLPAVVPSVGAAAQTFTVNSTADPGNGVCNGAECTLREAIAAANANAGADTIEFDIPGEGVQTIAPTEELPGIEEAVTIAGYSQDGASPNTKEKGTNAKLLIELSGANAPAGTDGLIVRQGPTTIRGLVVNRFQADAGSGGRGISMRNVAGNTDNVVASNFLGTDATGTRARANERGVECFGQCDTATIGGGALADRNLISGNRELGVFLNSPDNTVENNLIGTDKSGTKDLGNGEGGNGEGGIGLFASDNEVKDNVIAFNGGPGVLVDGSADGNSIRGNSIFKNTGLGIDLNDDGPTLNDGGTPPDADAGANGLQNFPVIIFAKPRKIKATLETIPNNLVIIEFFANPKGEKEGQRFLGAILVVSDANGVVQDGQGNTDLAFQPSTPLKEGELVTATASTGGDGTSEFSKAKKVT